MSPDLSTVMTKTDTKLVVEFNALGAAEHSLVNKTGSTVADKADIKRILTMSSSITKERKLALGDELGLTTKFLLIAFLQKSKESPNIQEITKFHKGFVQILRTVNTQFQTVTKNLSVIESIVPKDSAEEIVKNILVEMGRRASSAVGKFLFHRATLAEETTPKKLNAFLFEEHVSTYVFSKLSSQLINSSAQGFEINHLLFPKDPSKGAYLTFKEIRTAEFRNDMMGLLGGSQLVIRMATNDDLIRSLINVKDTAVFDNFEEQNSLASKLANTPFYLVPFVGVTNATDYFGHLAKNGVRGTVWASGSILTPSDLLKYYGTIAKRVYHMLLARPQNKAALIEKVFPGFTFDIEKDQEDVYVQLKAWALLPTSTVGWISGVQSFAEDATLIQNIKEVFNDVTLVSANHDIASKFGALMIKADTKIYSGTASAEPLLFTEVKNLAVTLRQGGIKPDDVLGDKVYLTSGGKKAKTRDQTPGMNERSRLASESRLAIKELNDRGYRALAKRMQIWFRLFLDESVQKSVASLFLARLESFLETPLVVTREERQGFMDPDNPDDEMPEDEPLVENEEEDDAEDDSPDQK